MCVKQELQLLFTLFSVVAAGLEVHHLAVDIGKNLTLPCSVQHNKDVMWVREGREDKQVSRLSIQDDGSLFLMEVDKNDSGIYACSPVNVVNDDIKARMNVTVRTQPPALVNVSVRPSTILALLLWKVEGDGGYPIIDFTAEYKVNIEDDEWKPISPSHISPNSRQLEVYKLEPNTSYSFRIWATNQLGKGDVVEVNSSTRFTVEEIELARHLLAGVENFDPRVWVIAAAIVLGTLVILGLGTCFLLYQECRMPGVVLARACLLKYIYIPVPDEEEVIELVPNIILNPGFDGNSHTEHIPADENSNNETTTRLNNNTVIQPRNV